MNHAAPLVSVVIPTFQRPGLVGRAVRCALAQTLSDLEVLVIVDGRDEATVDVLRQIVDPRLRVMVPPQHLGNAEARNAGVAQANGAWVAFLDDDDQWFPRKLELQLGAAGRCRSPHPIISCRLLARNDTTDFIWPRRFPRPGEPLSEYLFCRESPFAGEGIIQTSTLFTTRELLKAIPFRPGLRRYTDTDWLLRSAALEGAEVAFIPQSEPQVIWHIEEDRARISRATDWHQDLAWVRANRHLLTPRARASFIMTLVSASAARAGDYAAFLRLPLEACRGGRPSAIDLMTHVANFLIPQPLQRRLAARFARGSGTTAPGKT